MLDILSPLVIATPFTLVAVSIPPVPPVPTPGFGGGGSGGMTMVPPGRRRKIFSRVLLDVEMLALDDDMFLFEALEQEK